MKEIQIYSATADGYDPHVGWDHKGLFRGLESEGVWVYRHTASGNRLFSLACSEGEALQYHESISSVFDFDRDSSWVMPELRRLSFDAWAREKLLRDV